jgi:hypothetical protein
MGNTLTIEVSMKGLLVDILENKGIGNCSNNGISSRFKQVILVGPEIPEIFESTEETPAVRIVERNLQSGLYLTAYPVEPCPSNKNGYMMGGTFIWTSDSRFPSDYPIPLHDRME